MAGLANDLMTYEATVPEGVFPGMKFAAILGGQHMVFLCPPGVGPGQKVRVQGPRARQTNATVGQQIRSHASDSTSHGEQKRGRNRIDSADSVPQARQDEDEWVDVTGPDWVCPKCTVKNEALAPKCKVCFEDKPIGRDQVRCPACTTINKKMSTKCLICGTNLGGRLGGESKSDQANDEANSKFKGPPSYSSKTHGNSASSQQDQSWECALQIF